MGARTECSPACGGWTEGSAGSLQQAWPGWAESQHRRALQSGAEEVSQSLLGWTQLREAFTTRDHQTNTM